MFEKSEEIEALCPKTRCWLTAIFHKQISSDQFEIEWYATNHKQMFSNPTIIVSEIRKKPERI